ncbi:MAG: hypothetical protein ACREPE_06765 [Lysobacter sp.]
MKLIINGCVQWFDPRIADPETTRSLAISGESERSDSLDLWATKAGRARRRLFSADDPAQQLRRSDFVPTVSKAAVFRGIAGN